MLVCRKWMGWIIASAVYGGSCFYDRDNKPDTSVMQSVSGYVLLTDRPMQKEDRLVQYRRLRL